jgi:hypothetical protein
MFLRSHLRRGRIVVVRVALLLTIVVAARAANAPSELPPIYAELGPEQLIMRGGGWPYLFQARDGTTVVLGHLHWLPGKPEPLVFTTRSFDQRQTWQEWKPSPAQGAGPVTEGSAVELDDGRILIFDVYAYHAGNKVFHGKRWVSRDGWKTVTGPEPTRVSVPGVKTDDTFDDRGEPISRLYIRRSVIVLPNGDLLASAYGRFEGDDAPVEYRPAMKQHRSYLIRSSDEGKTWAMAGTIAVPPLGQEGPGEPVLVRLRQGPHAGRLICQLRVGREHPIYQTESDDEGKTWSKPRALSWTFSRFGRQRELTGVDPELIEMSDGTLVMGYGHKPDFMDHGNFLAFSRDHGATWEGETRLNASVTVAYVGVREISPGTLFVVYSRTDEQHPFNYAKAKFDTVGRTVVVKKKGS